LGLMIIAYNYDACRTGRGGGMPYCGMIPRGYSEPATSALLGSLLGGRVVEAEVLQGSSRRWI